MVEDGQVHWFGESWGAPVNEQPQDPVPVGRACTDCDKPIEAGDSGVTMLALIEYNEATQMGTWRRVPSHFRCHMQAILGRGWEEWAG